MTRRKETQKKPKLRLPVGAWLSYLLLLSLMLTGVTFSKYIAVSPGGASARVATIKELSVTETGSFSSPNEWIITPGVDMIKNASVRFDGSEMACYVFVEINAVGWQRTSERTFSYTDGGNTLMSWSVFETPLAFLEADESRAVYYTIVRPNTIFETELLANGGRITVSENMTRSLLEALPADMSIKITAIAVQYHGFGQGLPGEYTAEERARAAYETVKDR